MKVALTKDWDPPVARLIETVGSWMSHAWTVGSWTNDWTAESELNYPAVDSLCTGSARYQRYCSLRYARDGTLSGILFIDRGLGHRGGRSKRENTNENKLSSGKSEYLDVQSRHIWKSTGVAPSA